MSFVEAMSDDGKLSGRGTPWIRGVICGLMTTVRSLGHTFPYYIRDFHLAATIARGDFPGRRGWRAGFPGGRADWRRLAVARSLRFRPAHREADQFGRRLQFQFRLDVRAVDLRLPQLPFGLEPVLLVAPRLLSCRDPNLVCQLCDLRLRRNWFMFLGLLDA